MIIYLSMHSMKAKRVFPAPSETMRRSKVAALIMLGLLFRCSVMAQSKFMLRNYYPPVVDAPVFDAQGVPLAGSNYLAELWGGADSNSLAPLVLIDRGYAREIVPFRTGGYFRETSSSDNLCVLYVPPYGFAWLEVRAWDARLGNTYEAVAALGVGGYGKSPLFYAQGSDAFAEPPVFPAPLIGLQSFSLLPMVPEPSTWGLLGLGGAALCWARERRRRS
jgi:hypothetical protein